MTHKIVIELEFSVGTGWTTGKSIQIDSDSCQILSSCCDWIAPICIFKCFNWALRREQDFHLWTNRNAITWQTKHLLGSLFRTNRIRRNSIAKPMNTMDNLKESAILLQFIKQVCVNFGDSLTATKRLLPLDWTISSKVYRHVQLHLFKRNRYLTLRRCDGGRNSFPSC